MKPSIALPTGPYDWHPERIPLETFSTRVAQVREIMVKRGLTHAVFHGNGFDHEALAWLTHFTPKLGPAYCLLPAIGQPRLLFSGGPGMKPSAQKLTWVENVTALKSIERDFRTWLAECSKGGHFKLGLVEGSAMLLCDWTAVTGLADSIVELDDFIAACMSSSVGSAQESSAAQRSISAATETLAARAQVGTDIRSVILDVERAAYKAGAQDVRVLVGREPHAAPSTPPDLPATLNGPTWFALFVRCNGAWAERRALQPPA